ncbi:MAG: citrate synthase, partial [Deltaproteobacteria bacterium]|nr:citrate synthase [Deltaproteobacteria bacterium]
HSESRPLAKLLAIRHAMAEAGHEPPTLDFGMVALAKALLLPPGSAHIMFAVGRMAGWIAHILEQRTEPDVLRPRARYTGE